MNPFLFNVQINRLSYHFTGSKCNFYGGKTSGIVVIWWVFSKRYCTLILWWQNFLFHRHLRSFSKHWVWEKNLKNLLLTFCFDFIFSQLLLSALVEDSSWVSLSLGVSPTAQKKLSLVWPVGLGSWFFQLENIKSFPTKSEKDRSNFLVKSWNRRLTLWSCQNCFPASSWRWLDSMQRNVIGEFLLFGNKKYLISDIIVLSFVFICCWYRFLSYIEVFFWLHNVKFEFPKFSFSWFIDL